MTASFRGPQRAIAGVFFRWAAAEEARSGAFAVSPLRACCPKRAKGLTAIWPECIFIYAGFRTFLSIRDFVVRDCCHDRAPLTLCGARSVRAPGGLARCSEDGERAVHGNARFCTVLAG